MRSRKSGSRNVLCVILAAGAGTRMNSDTPKVLHALLGKPMLLYSVEAALGLGPDKVAVVSGKDNEDIIKILSPFKNVSISVQKKPEGTARALRSAKACLGGFEGTVLVINGDTPLLKTGTLKEFVALHRKAGNSLSLISFKPSDPASYGRVIRGSDGKPLKIVELLDLKDDQKSIDEVNSGVYAIESEALELLSSIKRNPVKGEYYLTDLVELSAKKGLKVQAYILGNEDEFMGVNTRLDLLNANEALRMRAIEGWAEKGVNFFCTDSVSIGHDVTIGSDTLIYPSVILEGKTSIGKNCTVYPNVRIIDSVVKEGSKIKDSTVIESSSIGPNAEIGPFAHVRPGCRIGSAKIGNFVETKKTSVGDGTKAMHLSYLGDASIGKGVNIGAGTITCNYDGFKKYRTTIGPGVFVGSDSQLVAPVTVGKGAYIGAGSTVTDDVPSGALAVSRTPQKNLKGWVRRWKTQRLSGKTD